MEGNKPYFIRSIIPAFAWGNCEKPLYNLQHSSCEPRYEPKTPHKIVNPEMRVPVWNDIFQTVGRYVYAYLIGLNELIRKLCGL